MAVSFDYGEFSTVNVSTGANVISVPALTPNNNRVVRLNVEASIGTRMQLEKIELNAVSSFDSRNVVYLIGVAIGRRCQALQAFASPLPIYW